MTPPRAFIPLAKASKLSVGITSDALQQLLLVNALDRSNWCRNLAQRSRYYSQILPKMQKSLKFAARNR